MTLTPAEWAELITAFAAQPIPDVTAQTYRRGWSSYSDPRQFKCDDGQDYVVKGGHLGKPVITDRIVGTLGELMGAPVGSVVLVNVPQILVDADRRIAPLVSGIHHGSRFIRDVSPDRADIIEVDMPVNRPRFAALALLYGWIGANDHQVVYNQQKPRTVHSVDHGHFFVGGPHWTIDGLHTAPPAAPDLEIINPCKLQRADLVAASEAMAEISDSDVARTVAEVPDDWGFTFDERVAVALYLGRRHGEILAGLSARPWR